MIGVGWRSIERFEPEWEGVIGAGEDGRAGTGATNPVLISDIVRLANGSFAAGWVCCCALAGIGGVWAKSRREVGPDAKTPPAKAGFTPNAAGAAKAGCKSNAEPCGANASA